MAKASSKTRMARLRDNFQSEVDGAALYDAMAARERKPEMARLYQKLAQVEAKHAAFWGDQIREAGGVAPVSRPSWAARVKIRLMDWLGVQAILPLIAGEEVRNRAVYDQQPEVQASAQASDMPAQERSHARLLSMLASQSRSGWNGADYSRLEGRHGTGDSNSLRAMVLGANDGLVSTFCLLMGMAGSGASSAVLLTTALAGGLAGACSMAMGEWVSVQSARELQERQIALEADELATVPAEEEEELRLIYQARGLPHDEARQLAARVIGDKDTALDTLVRDELGINPDDLGGSPWVAAVSSFLVFLLGALIPVLPMFLVSPAWRVPACTLSSLAGLFATGCLVAVFTGRHPLWSGMRQLLIGVAAAALTFGIGHVFGVALAA